MSAAPLSVGDPAADAPDNAVSVDILVQSPLWGEEPNAEAVVHRAIAAAAETVPDVQGEVAVVLTDDAAIQELNREWRKLDKPTNVLSFPAPKPPGGTGTGEPMPLGDIVIAYQTTAGEAVAEGKPLAHHLAHLAIHGFLHLLGYDHDSDAAAREMENLETRILAQLEVPDPYPTRDEA